MALPAQQIADHQTPVPFLTLTDELLEEIFFRLPAPADFVRASAACVSFRRIITDRSFLRRFRVVHPPPLLGFAAYEGFLAAQPPHPSAQLGDALAAAADFSYSFVPTGRWNTPWHPRDVRQGRVLLECTPECEAAFDYFDIVFLEDLELAVCDPLSRRYRLLPRIPRELRVQYGSLVDFGLFLAPTGADEDEESFSVVCMSCNGTMLVAFAFSSITGQWRIPACLDLSSLGPIISHIRFTSSCLEYQHCFYWTAPWRDKLLVLDALRLEFSIINNNLTGYHDRHSGQALIVEDGDGNPEVYFLADLYGDGPTELIRITKQNDGGSSDEWQFTNTISLPSQYNYFTLGAAEGFLFLRGVLQDQDSSSEESSENSNLLVESPDVEYFTLDVKTSELKKVCGMKQYFQSVYAYFGFPPPLTTPSI